MYIFDSEGEIYCLKNKEIEPSQYLKNLSNIINQPSIKATGKHQLSAFLLLRRSNYTKEIKDKKNGRK